MVGTNNETGGLGRSSYLDMPYIVSTNMFICCQVHVSIQLWVCGYIRLSRGN